MRPILLPFLLAALAGLAGCLTVSSPGQGVAHNDYEYCAQLVDVYSRYMMGDELAQRRNAAAADLDGRVAVAQCRQGNTSAGIPVLESKLAASGFTLPRRP